MSCVTPDRPRLMGCSKEWGAGTRTQPQRLSVCGAGEHLPVPSPQSTCRGEKGQQSQVESQWSVSRACLWSPVLETGSAMLMAAFLGVE